MATKVLCPFGNGDLTIKQPRLCLVYGLRRIRPFSPTATKRSPFQVTALRRLSVGTLRAGVQVIPSLLVHDCAVVTDRNEALAVPGYSPESVPSRRIRTPSTTSVPP